MKSFCISIAFAATNISEPSSWLSPWIIWTRRGLKIAEAFWGSSAHSPLTLLEARLDGTQPNGPDPVTKTLRAPKSYSLCKQFDVFVVVTLQLSKIILKKFDIVDDRGGK